jgi:nucleoside phosphorylase
MEKQMIKANVVKQIAQTLKIRKDMSTPTILVLGGKCEALFHSQIFYHLLHTTQRTNLLTNGREELEQSSMRLLRHGTLSDKEIRDLVFQSLPDTFSQASDICIAALLKQHFFQLVLSTCIDTGLEDALIQIGLREKRDFEVFMPNQSTTHLSFLEQNKASSFALVKMHGDITIPQYSLRKQISTLTEDVHLLQMFAEIRAWNMLLVGFDETWDDEIVPLLTSHKGSIWYVNTKRPDETSLLSWWLHKNHAQFLLGEEGQHDRFFKRLYLPLIRTTVLPLQIAEEMIETPIEEIAAAKSLTIPDYHVDILLLTTTQIESEALLMQWQNDYGGKQESFADETYYDLRIIGGARVGLMQISHPEQASPRLDQTIRLLAPAAIIVVGTAQGLKYQGQNIGDLLVSERLLSYKEEQTQPSISIEEKEEEIYERCVDTSVSLRLLSLCKCGNVALIRKERPYTQVRFGLICSSGKEISEREIFYLTHKQDSFALDISGSSLQELLRNLKVDCLFIKGIANWIDEDAQQGLESQKQAARNAAKFMLQVIHMGGFDTAIKKVS